MWEIVIEKNTEPLFFILEFKKNIEVKFSDRIEKYPFIICFGVHHEFEKDTRKVTGEGLGDFLRKWIKEEYKEDAVLTPLLLCYNILFQGNLLVFPKNQDSFVHIFSKKFEQTPINTLEESPYLGKIIQSTRELTRENIFKPSAIAYKKEDT